MSDTPPTFWGKYTLQANSPVLYPVPIVFTADAAEQLREEVALDGLEEAGGLFGTFESGEFLIDAINTAALPGRTGSSVEYDLERIDDLDDYLANGPTSASWIGSWHTHPRPGPAVPSDTDCRSWLSHARCTRIGAKPGRIIGRYAAVIVSPAGHPDGDWIKPALTGWIVDLSERGDHYVREVQVIQEAKPTPLRAPTAA